MTRDITLTNSVATALQEEKQDGETYSNVITRLLEETGSITDETEQLAQNAMNVSELQAAHNRGMTNVEYIASEYGIDAEQYGSSESLRAAKGEKQ